MWTPSLIWSITGLRTKFQTFFARIKYQTDLILYDGLALFQNQSKTTYKDNIEIKSTSTSFHERQTYTVSSMNVKHFYIIQKKKKHKYVWKLEAELIHPAGANVYICIIFVNSFGEEREQENVCLLHGDDAALHHLNDAALSTRTLVKTILTIWMP